MRALALCLALAAAEAAAQSCPSSGLVCSSAGTRFLPTLAPASLGLSDGGRYWDGGLTPSCAAGTRGTVRWYGGGAVGSDGGGAAIDGGLYLCPATGSTWAQVGSAGGAVGYPTLSPTDIGASSFQVVGSDMVLSANSGQLKLGGTTGAGIFYGAGYISTGGTTANLVAGGGNGAVQCASGYVSITGALRNTAAGVPLGVEDTEGLRLIGVATGSLATPATALAGTLQWDTTRQLMAYTDGGAWHYFQPASGQSFSALSSSPASESTTMAGVATLRHSSREAVIECSTVTAGTTSGGTDRIELALLVTGSEVCRCDIATPNCAYAAGTAQKTCTCAMTDGGAPWAVGARAEVRVTDNTNCGSNPQFFCNVGLIP